MSSLNDDLSITDSFGMPDSYTYGRSSNNSVVGGGGDASRNGGPRGASARDIYFKRKNFVKNTSLEGDVSEYHVEVS